MSPGLFAQMCGRGLRTEAGKRDCLILDFGENISATGPLTPSTSASGRIRSNWPKRIRTMPPRKPVPIARPSYRLTIGNVRAVSSFHRELKHDTEADTSSSVLAVPQSWIVEQVDLSRHTKKKGDGPDKLPRGYTCQPSDGSGNLSEKIISEWVCLEHPPGFAPRRPISGGVACSAADVPTSIDEAVDLSVCRAVAMPSHITTIQEGHFFRVISSVLDERPESGGGSGGRDVGAVRGQLSWRFECIEPDGRGYEENTIDHPLKGSGRQMCTQALKRLATVSDRSTAKSKGK